MFALSATEKKALKARAHSLNPILQLGEKGLSDAVIAEIERAIGAHELIKIRAAPLNRDEREVALASICERTNAHAIQHIGKMLVVYRKKPEEPKKPTRTLRPKSRTSSPRQEYSRPARRRPSSRSTPLRTARKSKSHRSG
jgi:putative YhbY family RNA-binding protein